MLPSQMGNVFATQTLELGALRGDCCLVVLPGPRWRPSFFPPGRTFDGSLEPPLFPGLFCRPPPHCFGGFCASGAVCRVSIRPGFCGPFFIPAPWAWPLSFYGNFCILFFFLPCRNFFSRNFLPLPSPPPSAETLNFCAGFQQPCARFSPSSCLQET